MQVSNIEMSKYFSRALKSSFFTRKSPNAIKANFEQIPIFELDKFLNSGFEARVYSIKGHDNIVARVKKGSNFNPLDIIKAESSNPDVLYKNEIGTVTIVKKKEGTPLHGHLWKYNEVPILSTFNNTYNTLEKLPDSVYEKYISDVINLRKKGINIDNVNPNNFLLNEKEHKINIIDLNKDPHNGALISIKDFYPFLDGLRIHRFYNILSPKEFDKIIFKTRVFLNRIYHIGRKNGVDLSMEKLNPNKPQDKILYIYYNDKSKIKNLRY